MKVQIKFEGYGLEIALGRIEQEVIDYFIEKNYSDDLNKVNNSERVMKSINRLREPIKKMDKSKQDIAMLFIQDLSKISEAIIN